MQLLECGQMGRCKGLSKFDMSHKIGLEPNCKACGVLPGSRDKSLLTVVQVGRHKQVMVCWGMLESTVAHTPSLQGIMELL